jgi:hypothetical protein
VKTNLTGSKNMDKAKIEGFVDAFAHTLYWRKQIAAN